MSQRKNRAGRLADQDQAEAYHKDLRNREREQVCLNFVGDNIEAFAAAAPNYFEQAGRGAFLVAVGTEWSPGNARGYYITENIARDHFGGWPDQTTARMVETYNPARQFVLIVEYEDGSLLSGKLSFAKAGIG